MDRIELKSEAKRLRSAMREVVGVVTTLAQSLELVAKTKNYPTWDAACGACSDGTAGVGPASKQLTHGKPMPGHLMLFCGMALGYADESQPVNSLRTERAALEEFATFRGI